MTIAGDPRYELKVTPNQALNRTRRHAASCSHESVAARRLAQFVRPHETARKSVNARTNQSSETQAMATIREGNTPVLMIVDVQVGVMSEAWDARRVIKNVSRAVERARTEGVPVIWVQHFSDELPTGSAEWRWVPELAPSEGESLIHKQFNSAFEQTSLDSELASLGATHIVLAGAATNWCIRATAYGALDRGYDLTLVKDAHTTESMQLEGGVMIEAVNVVRELNIAMAWLEYPGRNNSVASANEFDFAVPGGVK